MTKVVLLHSLPGTTCAIASMESHPPEVQETVPDRIIRCIENILLLQLQLASLNNVHMMGNCLRLVTKVYWHQSP